MVIYCIFQKTRKKSLNVFHCKEISSIWGHRHVYPNLSIMQYTHVSKHHILPHKIHIFMFYVSFKNKFKRICEKLQ
jgi:hypothetical protein